MKMIKFMELALLEVGKKVRISSILNMGNLASSNSKFQILLPSISQTKKLKISYANHLNLSLPHAPTV